ncbi:unnamed protein product [Allacma fusca]|uniref:Ion transport domain-containing protein n=1 Tax=Allacma fusca TaxID=39272 RepID=A0A8J2KM77_9HEXA|nr:unnamed protein product [Allacma fusca]
MSTLDLSAKKVSWASRIRRIAKNKQKKVDNLETVRSTEADEECSWNRNIIEKFQEDYKFWRKEYIQQDLCGLEARCQQVLESAMKGKLGALEESILIANGIYEEVNTCHCKGRSALHLAAAFGHTHIVQFLLEKGAVIDSLSEERLTPLMCGAASGNLTVIEVLISHGADINFNGNKTPLHWAVASGSADCVKKLITSGAAVNVPCELGVTPLLVAAAFGKVEIAKILLEHGADVRAVQGVSLDSALYLATAAGSMPCVKFFLEKLSPHIRNTYGETPLHLSESTETAALLLVKGGNPDAVDIYGRSPLHFAVMKEFLKLKTLVQYGADVNLQDKHGQTPLHLAAMQGASRKAGYLLSHGAKAGIKDNEGVSAYTLMRRKMPHAVPQIEAGLDCAVQATQNDPSEFDCLLSLDFSAIGMASPPVSDFRHSKILGSPSNLSTATSRRTQSLQKETDFIHDLVTHRDKDILAHPLIEAFIALKWEKVKIIFYLSFLFYLVMALVYTYFTTEAYLASCPDPGNKCTSDSGFNPMGREPPRPAKRWSWLETQPQRRSRQGRARKDFFNSFNVVHPVENIMDCDIKVAAVVAWGLLALCTVLVSLKEILEMIQRPKQYFTTLENLGQWAIVVSVVITSYWDGFAPCKCTKMCAWHYSSAAFGLLISWAMLLVRIGRFPGLGIYVDMLVKVLQNFGRFILVFLTMMNAFALSFCVIFPTEPAFSSYLQSMLKVFTMMTGELDYQELFYGHEQEDDAPDPNSIPAPVHFTSAGNGSGSEESIRIAFGLGQDLRYPLASHALYCVFTAVMTISLMNLLVALAVSDIQSLERRARVDRLCRQTRSIYRLENLLFSKLVRIAAPKRLLAYLKLKYLLQPSTKRCKFFIRPNDPRDEALPVELKAKLMEIVLKCKQDADSKNTTAANIATCLVEPPSENGQEQTDRLRTEKLEEQLVIIQNQLEILSRTLSEKMERIADILASKSE